MLAKKEISDSITAYVNVIEADKSFRFTLNDLNNTYKINKLAPSPVFKYNFFEDNAILRKSESTYNIRSIKLK